MYRTKKTGLLNSRVQRNVNFFSFSFFFFLLFNDRLWQSKEKDCHAQIMSDFPTNREICINP